MHPAAAYKSPPCCRSGPEAPLYARRLGTAWPSCSCLAGVLLIWLDAWAGAAFCLFFAWCSLAWGTVFDKLTMVSQCQRQWGCHLLVGTCQLRILNNSANHVHARRAPELAGVLRGSVMLMMLAEALHWSGSRDGTSCRATQHLLRSIPGQAPVVWTPRMSPLHEPVRHSSTSLWLHSSPLDADPVRLARAAHADGMHHCMLTIATNTTKPSSLAHAPLGALSRFACSVPTMPWQLEEQLAQGTL